METDFMVKHLTSNDNPLDVSHHHNGDQSFKKHPPQHKKQIRRRLHTNKPYKEKLLNMAEARREIVTALKFHRASMKQQEAAAAAATTNHRQSPPQSPLDHPKLPKSKPILSFYPPSTTTATDPYSRMSTLFAPPPPPLPPLLQQNYDNTTYCDDHNFVLPNQTLGLNLDFKSFSNLDTNIYHKPVYSSISSSISTPLSSSSKAPSLPPARTSIYSCDFNHHAVDGDEMEEIRSLGEQHQIEWNDTINLMSSARWSSFLKTMEGDGFHDQFDDQSMEFPPWLMNGNDQSLCVEEHFDDGCFQDPALACLDIGEIEAMDGEWLA